MGRQMVELTVTEYETIVDLLANARDNVEKGKFPAADEQIGEAIDLLNTTAEECGINPLSGGPVEQTPVEHTTIHVHGTIGTEDVPEVRGMDILRRLTGKKDPN